MSSALAIADFRLSSNGQPNRSTQYNSLGYHHLHSGLSISSEPYTSHLKDFLHVHSRHPIHIEDVLDACYEEHDSGQSYSQTMSTLCILSSYPPHHTRTCPQPPAQYQLGPNEVLLRVYRHVNGKPLYAHTPSSIHSQHYRMTPYTDSMQVCALTKGLRKYGWGKQNIQLAVCNDTNDKSADEISNTDVMGMYDGVLVRVLRSVTEEMGEEDRVNMAAGTGVAVDLYMFYDSQAGMYYYYTAILVRCMLYVVDRHNMVLIICVCLYLVTYGDLKKSHIQSLTNPEHKMMGQGMDTYSLMYPTCHNSLDLFTLA